MLSSFSIFERPIKSEYKYLKFFLSSCEILLAKVVLPTAVGPSIPITSTLFFSFELIIICCIFIP